MTDLEWLPVTQLIDWIRQEFSHIWTWIMSGDCNAGMIEDLIVAACSTGSCLDSPVPLEGHGEPRHHRRSDGDHWVYWKGHWHSQMGLPFWPLPRVKSVLARPAAEAIIEIRRGGYDG